VLTTTGRLNVTSSVVVTSPSLVLASSRTVHCIPPAVLMPGISHADQPAKGKQAAPGFWHSSGHSLSIKRQGSADLFPKALYKGRARIEQTMGKLKRFKRIALRCEKTAESYAALVAFACSMILVKFVHTV